MSMTKEQLMEALKKLPDGVEVIPNHLTNLIILNKEKDYIGYIDFKDGATILAKDIDKLEEERKDGN